MTVFITDVRNGDKFVEIRKETFPDGKFPASALITVTGLARPACWSRSRRSRSSIDPIAVSYAIPASSWPPRGGHPRRPSGD